MTEIQDKTVQDDTFLFNPAAFPTRNSIPGGDSKIILFLLWKLAAMMIFSYLLCIVFLRKDRNYDS